MSDWLFGLLAALGLELLLWEVLGNCPLAAGRQLRQPALVHGVHSLGGPPRQPASADLFPPGHSVQSVLTDLSFCGLGYCLGAVFLSLEQLWLSGVWIAVSELLCVWRLRDSLGLALVALAVPPDSLPAWLDRKPQQPGFLNRYWSRAS